MPEAAFLAAVPWVLGALGLVGVTWFTVEKVKELAPVIIIGGVAYYYIKKRG